MKTTSEIETYEIQRDFRRYTGEFMEVSSFNDAQDVVLLKIGREEALVNANAICRAIRNAVGRD